MDPPKLDYAPAGSERQRHAILLYFWPAYVLGALIGFPVVGVGTWVALFDHVPDQSGAMLLLLGVGVTAFLVGVVQMVGRRMLRRWSEGTAALAGLMLGMFSSLAGIAVGFVFFS